MLNLIAHRGPDDEGVFYDHEICLGHRRLSILDLSTDGHNPFFSNDQRYVIVYNGEVFNYLELRQELSSSYSFRSQTDTEVVLAAYMVWGKECVSKFWGMFAFAIWDRKERTLFCARDQFGIKPFYYSREGEGFAFASEIKCLLSAREERAPNYQIIYEYLNLGLYDHSENTFFEGISKLLPGHTLTVKQQNWQIEKYWDPEDAFRQKSEKHGSAAEIEDRLRDLLDTSVRWAMRSDVPMGINLSGGVDSAALLGISTRFNNRTPLKAFTQDYADPKYSERESVLKTVNFLGRDVFFSETSADQFWDLHTSVQEIQDEPYAGVPVAGYAGLYSNADQQGITVLLDGNGLDEALGGYKHYHLLYVKNLILSDDKQADPALDDFCREWGETREKVVQRIRSDARAGALLSKDGTQSICNDWIQPDFLKRWGANPPGGVPVWSGDVNELDRVRYMDVLFAKIPRSLRFNDRMSMAFSKELRVPFLNPQLFEFCFSLPHHYLFYKHRPKGLLRSVLTGIIPDEILQQPKQHIQTPQSDWLTGPLWERVRDVLATKAFRERGIFDQKLILSRWEGARNKPLPNSFFWWQLFNLESWFQLYFDAAADSRLSFHKSSPSSKIPTMKRETPAPR